MSPRHQARHRHNLYLFRDKRGDGPPAALSDIAPSLQATQKGRNGCIERLATAHLPIPQSMIASPLQCVVRRGGAELFGKKLLILVVVTDPIPKEGVVFEDGEGSIACANAN